MVDDRTITVRADLARIQARVNGLKELPLELLDDEQLRQLHLKLSGIWHDITTVYRRINIATDDAERIMNGG